MMKQISFLVALALLVTSSFAQESHSPKRIVLKVTVKDSIQRVDFGYLAALADSGIVMVKSPVIFDHSLASTNANIISYQNLSEVTIRRKGSVGRGILFGSLGGMLVGGIIGYATYKPVNCSEYLFCLDFGPGYNAAAGASVGTVGGAILGGVIGALAKKKFIIGGKKEHFHQMKASVLDMTYRK